MSQTLSKNRNKAFRHQEGRCFYCNAKMWLGSPSDFVKRYKLSKGAAARFQCTAEHLTARQDGGGNALTNIVAACLFCNQKRHARAVPLPVQPYKQLVIGRLRRSRWHPMQFHRLLEVHQLMESKPNDE